MHDFKGYTTIELQETLKCINFLENMSFGVDTTNLTFYRNVETELSQRSKNENAHNFKN